MHSTSQQFYQIAGLLFALSGISAGTAFFLGMRYRIWKMLRTNSEEIHLMRAQDGEAANTEFMQEEQSGEAEVQGSEAETTELQSARDDDAETTELMQCVRDDDAETIELRSVGDDDVETAELIQGVQGSTGAVSGETEDLCFTGKGKR